MFRRISEKDLERIEYPVLMQRKLDGVRATTIWDGKKLTLCTRNLKSFAGFAKLKKSMHIFLTKWFGETEVMLDGELFKKGKRLQEISSSCLSNLRKNKASDIEYHIFDIIRDPREPFAKRRLLVASARRKTKLKLVKFVDTKIGKSKEEVHLFYKQAVKSGFEGIIGRGYFSTYKSGERPLDVWKLKKHPSAEFLITDCLRATGVHKNAIIFECKTQRNKKFRVVPKWSIANRRIAASECERYKGKYLTVEYDSLSLDKIPQKPRGIVVRDYE